jgi:hypothetical protein
MKTSKGIDRVELMSFGEKRAKFEVQVGGSIWFWLKVASTVSLL